MADRSVSKQYTSGVVKAGGSRTSTADKAIEQLARTIDLLAAQIAKNN